MTFEFADYIPHGMIVAVATIAGWVFRDHVQRDDDRFKDYTGALKDFGEKLDTAIGDNMRNHAEILKILLEQKRE